MKFKAKIICTIKPTHPCYAGLDEKYRGKQKFDFKDTYTFNDDLWSKESAIAFMKNDMMLVAGGGYNTSHITDVKFEISEVI